MTTIINPSGFKDQYLGHLNTCFPGWGNGTKYDWVFSRKAGIKLADLILVRNENEEDIAGSAVSYRRLRFNQNEIDIGIMTGSWTLPAARGQGCFSKIINVSKELAVQNHAPFLTAFVTETNASSRRLREAGSIMINTHHLFSPDKIFNSEKVAVEVEITGKARASLYEQFTSRKRGFVRFEYNFEEFTGQFINRVNTPALLNTGGAYALLEETHNAMMLLFIAHDLSGDLGDSLSALANWAKEKRSKKLLLFSTNPALTEACLQLGFEAIPGYFTMLGEDPSFPPESYRDRFDIQAGDKM